jgi:hypothetical protein
VSSPYLFQSIPTRARDLTPLQVQQAQDTKKALVKQAREYDIWARRLTDLEAVRLSAIGAYLTVDTLVSLDDLIEQAQQRQTAVGGGE